MKKPVDLKDLAEQLQHASYSRITAIADILGVDSATDFLDEIPEGIIVESADFARYIPIIREVVSVKKYDYTLKTHIIFWLADGEPYIYTPTPTIEHTRVGSSLKQLKRGSHLMIPHNCKRYDILALRDGCYNHTGEEYLELVITTNKIKGSK